MTLWASKKNIVGYQEDGSVELRMTDHNKSVVKVCRVLSAPEKGNCILVRQPHAWIVGHKATKEKK